MVHLMFHTPRTLAKYAHSPDHFPEDHAEGGNPVPRSFTPRSGILNMSEFLARRSNLVHVAGGWAHFPVPENFHMNIFRISRRPNRTFLRFWWLGHQRRRKRPQNKKPPFVLDPLSLSTILNHFSVHWPLS